MQTNPEDKDALRAAARRFAWMTLAIYAGLTVGLWIAHAMFPETMGAVTDYTVSVSLMGAITFGGLYAAAMTLRPTKPQPATVSPR